MVKTAFFDHGRLVFTASNLRKDRLGASRWSALKGHIMFTDPMLAENVGK